MSCRPIRCGCDGSSMTPQTRSCGVSKGTPSGHSGIGLRHGALCRQTVHLGFSDDGFNLPPLNVHKHLVAADRGTDTGEEKRGKHIGQLRLMRMPDTSATSIHKEKRLTIADRAAKVAELIKAEPDEPWIIWCDTDYEEAELREAIPSAMPIRGSMSIDMKEERLVGFSNGEIKHLLTKPRIAGYGLNWQHCARMAFAGLSFSYEAYYQAVRRCWRFRQARPVDCHVICADTEAAIWDVVSRKAGDHNTMKLEMSAAMQRAANIVKVMANYEPTKRGRPPTWLQYQKRRKRKLTSSRMN